MYRIGLSSCGFLLNEENFRKLNESGISAIEISMKLDDHRMINHQELSELSKRYNVELWSYHLPFGPFSLINIASMSAEKRKYTIELYTELIKKASDIGVDKFIVHPSGEPYTLEEREDRIKYSMESLDSLAEIAHGCGAVIAVEDLPRTCIGNTADEMLRLLSANDKLRVCFDTNHLLADTNINFIKKVGNKIVTLHVSDYDFIDEKHWFPGEGAVDFHELYSALREVGYDGVWMYEIGLRPPKTMPRSRNLTFEDFVENAKAIFDGKRPKRIY
ncbi:MAG: sugar phosphate isomerase/epimerase [Ruminococcaceae bacterium]|nr:sugar phosphate isomerase/epimerase [Oscillospiraceae bacterium]